MRCLNGLTRVEKKWMVCLLMLVCVAGFELRFGATPTTASEDVVRLAPSATIETTDAPQAPEALFHLGMQYLKGGKGIRKNKPLAEHYLLLASEAGWADAQVQVAMLYLKAPKAKRNDVEARRWLTQASQGGNATAQFTLALLWIQGRGGEQAFPPAVALLKQAVNQGYIPAYTALGILYTTGQGVTPNLPLAVQYLQEAAQHQDAVALFRLGLMYQTGLGVKKNSLKALEYLHLAEKGKYRSAKKYVEAIESQLKASHLQKQNID